MKQGLSDVLLFCDSFLFVFGLKIFFNSPTISTYEAGISDVLLFVIPFIVFGLKSIFNSPTQFLRQD
jgi:hypothetical protein